MLGLTKTLAKEAAFILEAVGQAGRRQHRPHREHRDTRLRGDRDGRGRSRRRSWTGSGRRSRSVGSAVRRRSRASSTSSPRTARPTSPARSGASTAAWTCSRDLLRQLASAYLLDIPSERCIWCACKERRPFTVQDQLGDPMATTTTKTTPTTEMPELAQKIREQLVSTVQQGQQMSARRRPGLGQGRLRHPRPGPAHRPRHPHVPDVEAATKYTFDVAADLLNAQRDFAAAARQRARSRKVGLTAPRASDQVDREYADGSSRATTPGACWATSSARSDRWPTCRCASCLPDRGLQPLPEPGRARAARAVGARAPVDRRRVERVSGDAARAGGTVQ